MPSDQHQHFCRNCPIGKQLWTCTASMCENNPHWGVLCYECSQVLGKKLVESQQEQPELFQEKRAGNE